MLLILKATNYIQIKQEKAKQHLVMPIHINQMFNVNEIIQLDKTKRKLHKFGRRRNLAPKSSEKIPISSLESNSRPSEGNDNS